jgi:copper chaperone NosL
VCLYPMPKRSWQVFTLLTVFLLSACSADPGTGPAEVKWDRSACERCRMVLSDRRFAVQVRYLPKGKRHSQVIQFDDIGCATLWLQDKSWKDDLQTQIWVADHRNGNWINARTASYIKDKLTPMEYGLGAQSDPAPNALDFEQAKAHILEVEKRFNIHGIQLLDRLKWKAAKREAERKTTREK